MDVLLCDDYIKFYTDCERVVWNNIEIPILEKQQHVSEIVAAKMDYAKENGSWSWLPAYLKSTADTKSQNGIVEPPMTAERLKLQEIGKTRIYEGHIISVNNYLESTVPTIISDINRKLKEVSRVRIKVARNYTTKHYDNR